MLVVYDYVGYQCKYNFIQLGIKQIAYNKKVIKYACSYKIYTLGNQYFSFYIFIKSL